MPCFENAGRSVVEHEELCEDLICGPPRTSSFPGLFLNVPFLTQKSVHYRSEILFLPHFFILLHHFFLSPSSQVLKNHEQSPRKSKVHGKGGRR